MTLKDSDILNLPEAPDFISKPPVYTAAEMIKICEPMLPYWNRQRNSSAVLTVDIPPFSLEEESEADRR